MLVQATVAVEGAAAAGSRAGTDSSVAGADWRRLGKSSWADETDDEEWDVDCEALAQMEAREDLERGADDANLETFGACAGQWCFEQQVEANRRLEAEPVPSDPAWPEMADSLSTEQQSFVTMAKYLSSGLL